jgi:hypothetical protein
MTNRERAHPCPLDEASYRVYIEIAPGMMPNRTGWKPVLLSAMERL